MLLSDTVLVLISVVSNAEGVLEDLETPAMDRKDVFFYQVNTHIHPHTLV